MAGIFHGLHRLAVEHFRAFLSHRAAGEACLAEPATADAAPEYLQICPIVNDLRAGHDHFRGPIGVIQILHNPLCADRRGAVLSRHTLQSAVFMISMLIKTGNIDTGNFRNLQQKGFLGPILSLCAVVEPDDLRGDLLAFAQGEEVYKIRQRLRIKGADAARKHHIVQSLAVLRVQGHTGQGKHIQNVGIAHFIADGKGDHVEILNRGAAFQSPKGNIVAAHGIFHIRPGGKDSLTPDTFHFVHHSIEDPHTQIGHADLIGIRETKGHMDPNIFGVFHDFIIFAACVPRRLLHRGQNAAELILHGFIPQKVEYAYCNAKWPALQGIFASLVRNTSPIDAISGKTPICRTAKR